MENPDDPTGAPANLPFLEILSEFTNKLLKQDKKVVLDYLDKRIGSGMPSRLVILGLLILSFSARFITCMFADIGYMYFSGC